MEKVRILVVDDDSYLLSAIGQTLMLHGWEKSPGAQIERLWAKRTGKAIFAPTMLGSIEAMLMNEELT